MDRLVLILCNFVWILSFYCSVKSVLNADVYSEESSIPVRVIQPNLHRRSLSSAEDLTLKFRISSQPVILKLHHNAQVNSPIPIYVISQNGSVIREHLFNGSEGSIYYYDPEHGATFSIQSVNGRRIRMYGTFHFGNEEYIIEYRNNSNQAHHSGINQPSDIYRFNFRKTPNRNQQKPNMTAYHTNSKTQKTHHSHRRSRRAPAYFVEVLFVVDYSIYKHWLDKSSGSTLERKDADAVNSIRQFYAFVVSGMDGRYRSISSNFMAIAFAGIVISKNPSDSPWTEDRKTYKAADSVYYVDAHQSLNDFSNWVKKQKTLPDHDHAMLLTRYSLSSKNSDSLEGYAYVGAMCSPDSQSVMEESNDYIMMTVAAHELGHSLGAGHDGASDSCKKDDFYIMAATSFAKLGNPNPWRFSSCSVQAFQRLIQKLNSERRNCLTSFGSSYNPNALNSYLSKLPGQLYSADEQCIKYHGTGSSLCREQYNGDFRPMCGLMWCRDTRTGGCRSMVPADGTLCANKHWCRNGVCSYSSQAASVPDNCVHGDFIGEMDHRGRTCAQIISGDKTECYRDRIAKSCCGSCAKSSSGVTEKSTTRRYYQTTRRRFNKPRTTTSAKTTNSCLYGDRIPSSLCNKTACPYYSKDELSKCCHTCSAYFVVPTTPTMPTESDGTNEILIGISVAIVLIAVGLGIWVHRRTQVPTKRAGKAMKVKTVQNSHTKPSLPPPRKPLSTASNGKQDYNSNATKNLISMPTLKSHTNKNLGITSERPNPKDTRKVNGEPKTKPISRPNTASKQAAHKSNASGANGGIRNPGNQAKCINNRNPMAISKKDTTSSATKTSSEAKGLLKPASKPADSDKVDTSATSIKDRIAALNNKEPNTPTSNKTNSTGTRPAAKAGQDSNIQGPKVALKPPGSRPDTAKPSSHTKPLSPTTNKPVSKVNSGKTSIEPKLPNYRPMNYSSKTEADTKPKVPTAPKPSQGQPGSSTDTPEQAQYRPMNYGKQKNIRKVDV